MEKQNWVQRLLGRKSEREARKQTAPQPLQATEPRGTGDAALAASAEQSLKKTTPVIADSSAFVAPLSTADAEANVPAVWRMGDVILGQYEVAGKLGEGGMGTVYKVHHRGWNTDLAVKSPKPAIFARARGREDFTREAETWVNLELHPHIVSCYYVRTLGGIPRVFAEYVTGGSLSDWIRTRRLYEGGHERALERILDVAIQFAWGLHAAHEQGLVHLDVKPANVMMTVDGTAKVTDFGLAKARVMAGEADVQGEQRDEQSILVSVRGMTPAYCSPEQSAGQHVSRKTDIWSWGVSLLELFVGKVTWLAGPGARDVLASHERRDPMIPLMPASVVQLLSRCFQQQPTDRPATMLEVASELQTISAQLLGRLYPRQAPRPATTIVESLNNRALSLYDLGKIEEAKRVWEQALQANPQHLETTYNRGVVLWRRGELPDDQLVHQLEALRIAQAREWQVAYFLAQVHLERGNAETGQLLLEDAAELAPGRRIIEELLEQTRAGTIASARCLRVLLGHKLAVKSVALDAGGRFLASGSWDHTVRLWETASGRCLHLLQEHSEEVNSVCLSADGHLLASGGGDTDLESLVGGGQERISIVSDGTIWFRTPSTHPRGNERDYAIRLWETESGRCLRTLLGHTRPALSVSLSADGRLVASGSADRTVRLWETASGRCLRVFQGHTDLVMAVSLSADGSLVASGSWDHIVRLWETTSGRCLHILQGHTDRVRSVFLSADQNWLVSGSNDQTVRLWETASGRCLRIFRGHTELVMAVALSADGRWMVSGSMDRTMRLWETASGRCLHTFEHAGLVNTVCLSADGSLAASGGEDRIEGRTAQLWKIPDLPRSFCALCFSQVFSYADVLQTETRATGILQQAEQARTEARFAAALELLREVRALPDWNFHPGVLDAWAALACFCSRVGLRAGWPVRTFQGHAEVVSSVSLSADGRLALSGSWDRTMRLWETTTGRCLRIFEGHTAQVLSVCLSVDGQRAVSGSSDKTVRLWETATGRCLRTFEGHASAVRSVCLSADGHWIVSGSADKTVQLWDTATGRGLWSFQGHSEEISSVGLSADGRLVISSEANPLKKDHFAIRLWDPASGRCLITYQELPYSITSVRLSPDGQRMVYSFGEIPRGNLNLGKYSTIHLMEVATARSLCGFQGHTLSVTSLDLSADGKILASGSQDHSIRLWETTTGRCLHIFQGHTDDVTSVRFSTDGRFLASGSRDATMRLWELDWELAAHELADWDDGARSYLETFLTLHTPYAGELRQSAAISPQGLQHILTSCGTSQLIDQLHKELRQALTHRGTPTWNAHDFQELMRHLQQTGYGWLRPGGVWRKLEEMAHAWQGPPPLPGLLQGRE